MDRSKRGFTLIELLAVIAIIGILAGVVTISYASSRIKSRDAKRKSDVIAINDAVKLYAVANQGKYPRYTPDSDRPEALCASTGEHYYKDSWINLEIDLTPYIEGGKLPLDPIGKCNSPDEPWDGANSKKGYVVWQAQGTSNKYSIWAALENTKDPDTNSEGDGSIADPSTGKYNKLYQYKTIKNWSVNSIGRIDNIANIYGKGLPCTLDANGVCTD